MKTAWLTLKAKDVASAENLEESLLNLKRLSDSEPGKAAYEIFRSETDNLDYFVRESWQNEQALNDHLNTPHLQKFAADANKWLNKPFETNVLKQLGKYDNEAIIRGLYEAVNTKNLDYIRQLGADFSEWLDVPFDYTTTGKDAIIDPWVSWFGIFPDASCEVRRLVSFDDYVIAQGTGRGTHQGVFNSPAGVLQPSGVRMQVQFCDVYKLKDGKIDRADSYFDFYDLLRQLAPEKVAS